LIAGHLLQSLLQDKSIEAEKKAVTTRKMIVYLVGAVNKVNLLKLKCDCATSL
jgi:osmotically-inducible protein OsmY